MTRVKFCGLTRICDIEAANELRPDYVGFVLAPQSRRYVPPEAARELKHRLAPGILAVGVFVNAPVDEVARLLEEGIIDLAQLHGGESEEYIQTLRILTARPVIKAFRVETREDVEKAQASGADLVLLDSKTAGSGTAFDWALLEHVKRPYFLAGGLHPGNVGDAVRAFRPFAVDVSSGIETNGVKDRAKMAEFMASVRKEGAK